MLYSSEAEQQMFSMIGCWQQSGLTQKSYCEQHSIRYHVFHYWYRKYRKYRDSQTSDKQPGFIPVQLQSSAAIAFQTPSAVGAHIELVLTDGRRLLFHQPVSADYLKALIS